LNKSFSIFSDAALATLSKGLDNKNDNLIFVINYIIDYFTENPMILKIIYKNFSWKLFKNSGEYEEIKIMLLQLKQIIAKDKTDDENFEKNLFMIFALTGSVCYYSLIFNEPEPIDSIKPTLFKMLSKMIY